MHWNTKKARLDLGGGELVYRSKDQVKHKPSVNLNCDFFNSKFETTTNNPNRVI